MATQLRHGEREFAEIHSKSARPLPAPASVFSHTSKAEKLFIDVLSNISQGFLEIVNHKGQVVGLGDPNAALRARIIIHNRSCYEQMLSGGSLGFSESYMDGSWDVEDDKLADLVGIFILNDIEGRVHKSLWTKLCYAVFRFFHLPLFRSWARRCVRKHYDLSNDFFSLMLDESMTYSCGYQRKPGDSLAEMQEQKYDLICSKVGLEQGGMLVDVGCGWGGFLRHVGRRYDAVNGLGITLSKAQCDFAARRLQESGLADRFAVELKDYRDLRGTFDFFVSIGMFEHVGRACYSAFIRRTASVLRHGGRGLLHTIGVTYPPHVPPDSFTSTYIFPGSRLPRLEEIVSEMRRAELVVVHVENLKLHYAETLRKWKENFDRHRPRIRLLGPQFDERFMRMWNLYLQGCEAGFRYGGMQVYQVLFCKGKNWPFPLTFER